MDKIKVMVNSANGRMGRAVAEAVALNLGMELYPFSFVGYKTEDTEVVIADKKVELLNPRRRVYFEHKKDSIDVAVDCTNYQAAVQNGIFYTQNGIVPVIGTSLDEYGRSTLENLIRKSERPGIISPNMAEPVVFLIDFLERFADKHPLEMTGYRIQVEESHQRTKAGKSATAKHLLKAFHRLGFEVGEEDIVFYRSEEDYERLGVPREFWDSHAWHSYTITAPDLKQSLPLTSLSAEFLSFFTDNPTLIGFNKKVEIGFSEYESKEKDILIRVETPDRTTLKITHNVNGKQPYVRGFLRAINLGYLIRSNKGVVCDMMSVINGKLPISNTYS